jgi:hypothetical protein
MSRQDAIAAAERPGGPHRFRWGKPGLTSAEQMFGWRSCDVPAKEAGDQGGGRSRRRAIMKAGDPQTPVNAVTPRAWARRQLRFVRP